MSEQIALSLEDVHVSYTIMPTFSLRKSGKRVSRITVNAVNGVSFSLTKGEVVGIIGKNGSGKSTLLQAIAGIISPDSGTIDARGNRVSLMALGNGFHRDLSGRENIILAGMLMGYSKAEVLARMDAIIEFSELGEFIDYPVRTYSSGMYSKLTFSISSILDTSIILIDEVLSVGDEKFRKKSYKKLRELIEDNAHTVIFVSHSLDKVKLLCDRVIWMDEGKIRRSGNPKAVVAEYEETEI